MSERFAYPSGLFEPGSYELNRWRSIAYERGLDLGGKGADAVSVIREAVEINDRSISGQLVAGYSSGLTDHLFPRQINVTGRSLSQTVRRSFFWEMRNRLHVAVEETRRLQAKG
jgi:hypothetical protein